MLSPDLLSSSRLPPTHLSRLILLLPPSNAIGRLWPACYYRPKPLNISPGSSSQLWSPARGSPRSSGAEVWWGRPMIAAPIVSYPPIQIPLFSQTFVGHCSEPQLFPTIRVSDLLMSLQHGWLLNNAVCWVWSGGMVCHIEMAVVKKWASFWRIMGRYVLPCIWWNLPICQGGIGFYHSLLEKLNKLRVLLEMIIYGGNSVLP